MLEICMAGMADQERHEFEVQEKGKKDYRQKMAFVAKKNHGKYHGYANILNICQVLCSLEYYGFQEKVNYKVNYYLQALLFYQQASLE